MIYTIYRLVDPRDGLPHYVGCTEAPERRYEQHLTGETSNRAKSAWIQELKALGLYPVMQELEQVQGTIDVARQREVYWIHHLMGEGIQLFNSNNAVTEPLRGITLYLSKSHQTKLKDLDIAFWQRHRHRINRNDIIRHLIEVCDLDSLNGLAPKKAED